MKKQKDVVQESLKIHRNVILLSIKDDYDSYFI